MPLVHRSLARGGQVSPDPSLPLAPPPPLATLAEPVYPVPAMADSGGDDGYSSDSDLDLSTTTQSLPVLAPGPAPSGSHQALQHKPKGKQPQRKDSNKDNPDKEPRKRSSKACASLPLSLSSSLSSAAGPPTSLPALRARGLHVEQAATSEHRELTLDTRPSQATSAFHALHLSLSTRPVLSPDDAAASIQLAPTISHG